MMLTAFVTSSAVMLPRPWHWPSALPPDGLVGPGFTPPDIVGCAGGAPATGGWPGAAPEYAEPRSAGMHWRRRVRS